MTPPDPPPATSRANPPFLRPELNALRFLAFLLVFFDHAGVSFTGPFRLLHDLGAFGLGLFFTLSAFLIVTLLLRERDRTGTVSVRKFIARRILRIWPLYFAAIALSLLIGLRFPSTLLTRRALVAMSLLAGNLAILQRGWLSLGRLITPLWSISLEEQFYLAVPWAAKLLSRSALTLFFTLVLLIAYLTLWSLGQAHAGLFTRVWPNSFVQFQFFAAGAFIALAGRQLPHAPAARVLLLLAGFTLWYLAQHLFHVNSWLLATSGPTLCAGYALLLLGTIAIFCAFLGAHARFPAPLLHLGVISYGLYAFHQFWLSLAFLHLHLHNRWLAVPSCLALTIASALVSYHFFEKPILRRKAGFEVIRTPAP